MDYLNSTPHYYAGSCSGEYIDQFYAWMVTNGADKRSRQCMGRLATRVKTGLLSEVLIDELTFHLNALADDLNSSLVRLSNLSESLEKIELRVTSFSPKARLLSKISCLGSYDDVKGLLDRLGKQEFSRYQAEGVMRDLKFMDNPKPEDVALLFNSWEKFKT